MKLATISLTSIAALALFAATSQAAPRSAEVNTSLDRLATRSADSRIAGNADVLQVAGNYGRSYYRGHGHHGHHYRNHYPSHRSYYHHGYHSPRSHYYHSPGYRSYRGGHSHYYGGSGFGIHGRNFSFHFGY